MSACLLSPSKNTVSFQTMNGLKLEKLVATTTQPPPTNLDKPQTMTTSKQYELPQPPITQDQSNAYIGGRKGTPHNWVNIHATFAEGPRRGECVIWQVRKELTNAQGWHKGATSFWVPKRSRLPTRDCTTTTRDTRQLRTLVKYPAQVKAIEIDKTKQLGGRAPHKSTPQAPLIPLTKTSQVWVLKNIQTPLDNTRTTHPLVRREVLFELPYPGSRRLTPRPPHLFKEINSSNPSQ